MNKFSSLKTKKLGLRNRLLLQTVSIALVLLTIILIANYAFTESIFVRYAKKDILSISEEIKTYDLYTDSFYSDIAEFESKKNVYIEIYLLPDILIYSTQINGSLYVFGGTENDKAEPKERLLRTIEMPVFNDDGSFFDIKQEINGTAKYVVYNDTFNNLFAIKIYESIDVINSSANLTK